MHRLFPGLWSRLRLPLAATFLVPWLAVGLVLAGPVGAASAAVQHSGAVAVAFEADRFIPGQWLSCTATAYYRTEGDADSAIQTVHVKAGDCDTGTGYDLQSGQLTLAFNGETGTGSACSLTGSSVIAEGDETFGPIQAGSLVPLAGAQQDLCIVDEFCWDVAKDNPFYTGDIEHQGCEALPMGTPAMPAATDYEGECQWWEPSDWKHGPAGPRSAADRTYYPWEVTLKAKQELLDLPITTVLVIAEDRNGDGKYPDVFTAPRSWSVTDWQNAANVDGYKVFRVTNQTFTHPVPADSGPGAWPYTVIGMQVMRAHSSVAPANWWTGTPEQGGRLGVTDAANCSFYMGIKITNYDDGTAVPEPWLPLPGEDPPGDNMPEPDPVNDPPTPKAEECSFSFSDPSTWLEGGMCAAVGLLGRVVSLLGDAVGFLGSLVSEVVALAGRIVSGILGGLADLFVPADGYLDGKVDTTRTNLEDTSPGKWMDALEGLVPGGVSGCGGITIEPPGPEGQPMFSEQLGAACSGKMAEVAQVVRLGISASVVVGGALACVKALGSGLGWNPGVGRGEGA